MFVFLNLLITGLSLKTVEANNVSAPSNDDIENATEIAGGVTVSTRGSLTDSNLGATLQPTEDYAIFLLGPPLSSVWYKIKLSPGRWKIATTKVSFDTVLIVGTIDEGTQSLSNFSYVDQNASRGDVQGGSSRDPESLVIFTAETEVEYFIGVAVNSYYETSVAGTFNLEWTPIQSDTTIPLENDDFQTRFRLNEPTDELDEPLVRHGLTLNNATLEDYEIEMLTSPRNGVAVGCDGDEWCSQNEWKHSVWFQATLGPGDWSLTAELDDPSRSYDPQTIAVFTSTGLDEPTGISSLTNVRNGSALNLMVQASTTYYIAVSFNYGVENPVRQMTSFDLRIRPVIKPQEVLSLVSEVWSNSTGVEITWALPSNFGQLAVQDLVYDVLIEHESVNSPISPSGNTVLNQYCSRREQYVMMSIYESRQCSFSRLAAGTWNVSIYIFDYDQQVVGEVSTGSFTVSSTWHDAFVAPRTITESQSSLRDNFSYATLEANEPIHSTSQTWSSLWYQFTPIREGSYTFSVNHQSYLGIEVDLEIAVYSGETLSSLSRLGFGKSVTFNGASGQNYRLAVSTTTNFMGTRFDEYGQDEITSVFSLSWSRADITPSAPTPEVPPTVVTPISEVPNPGQLQELPLPPVVSNLPQSSGSTPPSAVDIKKPVLITSAKPATLKTLVSGVGLVVPKGSKTKIVVSPTSKKYCKVVGSTVRAISSGKCVVTVVVVTPSKGKLKATTKTKKVTVTVSVPKKKK